MRVKRAVAASAPTATTTGASSPEVSLVTVPNIEILEVGEAWCLSTGEVDFTPEQLVSAIESQEDPAVRTPVLKLGHVDPRFDGQPSFGRLQNMRLTNQGNTLVCDAVGVPFWLAKCMSTAYPRRSIEGNFDVTTRTGNTWPLVLTGLALLGDMYPGVETLEDLELLWGEEQPPLYPVEGIDELAASGPGFRGVKMEDIMGAGDWLKRKTTQVAAAAVAASASLDDVRKAFYDSLGPGQMWWWIREIQVNPLTLIVDDDEGNLWQVPVNVDADDNITFGDPVAVKVEYVAAGSHRQPGQLLAAAYGKPEDTGRTHKPNDGSPEKNPSDTVLPNSEKIAAASEEEHQEMKLTPEALAALGLAADASEADINAAVLAKVAASASAPAPEQPESEPNPAPQPEPQPANEPAGNGEKDGDNAEPETQAATAPTLQVPEGMQLIDSETLKELQSGVAAARRLEASQLETQNAALLDSAIRAGKFPPSRREHYATMLKADREGTTTLLASLAENLIPVAERGAVGGETQPEVQTAYPASWKRHVAAARRGVSGSVKVVQD